MRSVVVFIVLLFAVIATCTYVPPEEDDSCYCDYCVQQKNNEEESGATSTLAPKDLEDSDGDGDLRICARDRDFDDRTFRSVCHMLCYNRCTRLRYLIEDDGNAKQYIVNGYRTRILQKVNCTDAHIHIRKVQRKWDIEYDICIHVIMHAILYSGSMFGNGHKHRKI